MRIRRESECEIVRCAINIEDFVSTVTKYGQNNSNQELQIVVNLFAHFWMVVIIIVFAWHFYQSDYCSFSYVYFDICIKNNIEKYWTHYVVKSTIQQRQRMGECEWKISKSKLNHHHLFKSNAIWCVKRAYSFIKMRWKNTCLEFC